MVCSSVREELQIGEACVVLVAPDALPVGELDCCGYCLGGAGEEEVGENPVVDLVSKSSSVAGKIAMLGS